MRRNRKNSIKKERIIMIASSAFVLAALTMTGIYMKDANVESKDDGYTLDFTALEDNAEDKFQEIAQNDNASANQVADHSISSQSGNGSGGSTDIQQGVTENDLDYMPMEAGSNQVEIPGVTNQVNATGAKDNQSQIEAAEGIVDAQAAELEEVPAEEKEAAASNKVVVEKTLSFSEEAGLVRPVSGDVVLPYSMDSSIYFATLDQYKYNPAVVIAAPEGTSVKVCAEGKVTSVYTDAEIGKAVTIDLGSGYQATYGQLKDIEVSKGAYVNAGEVLGAVAAPTKYYSTEGSNVYFQLTKDGAPVNPEGLFE